MTNRELDAKIAEQVLGATWAPTESGSPTEEALAFREGCDQRPHYWSLVWRYSNGKPLVYKESLRHYSSEIKDAFRVVEAMRAKGFYFDLRDNRHGCYRWTKDSPPLVEWYVTVAEHHAGEDFPTDLGIAVSSPSLPEAICLAALKALEASSPKSASEAPASSSPSPEPGNT